MISAAGALAGFRQYANQLAGSFPRSRPGEAEAEKRTKAQEAHALMLDRGVPGKLAREVCGLAGSHTPQRTRAFGIALAWWAKGPDDKGRDALVLAGDRGRGKSYAAAQVILRSKPGSHAIWVGARQIVDMLHDRSNPSSQRRLERCKRAGVMVLDDLGWEHLDRGGYALSAFIGLLDDRMQSELRTVMTTNLDEQRFRERYGDALHDRVRGYGVWVDVPAGASMR